MFSTIYNSESSLDSHTESHTPSDCISWPAWQPLKDLLSIHKGNHSGSSVAEFSCAWNGHFHQLSQFQMELVLALHLWCFCPRSRDFQAQMDHSLFGLGNLHIQPIHLHQVPPVVPVYSTLCQREHYLSNDIWHTSIESPCMQVDCECWFCVCRVVTDQFRVVYLFFFGQ